MCLPCIHFTKCLLSFIYQQTYSQLVFLVQIVVIDGLWPPPLSGLRVAEHNVIRVGLYCNGYPKGNCFYSHKYCIKALNHAKMTTVILLKTCLKGLFFFKPLRKYKNITVTYHKDALLNATETLYSLTWVVALFSEHVSYTVAVLFTLLNLIQWRICADNSQRQSRLG